MARHIVTIVTIVIQIKVTGKPRKLTKKKTTTDNYEERKKNTNMAYMKETQSEREINVTIIRSSQFNLLTFKVPLTKQKK